MTQNKKNSRTLLLEVAAFERAMVRLTVVPAIIFIIAFAIDAQYSLISSMVYVVAITAVQLILVKYENTELRKIRAEQFFKVLKAIILVLLALATILAAIIVA